MRRPLRNIEIFSMSVLDMFASALGAFILIAVILFPYYNQAQQLTHIVTRTQEVAAEISKVSESLARDEDTSRRQQAELAEAPKLKTSIDACRDNIARCKAALTRTFLVIGIEWQERAVIDLYVTDPRNNRYWYGQRSFPGSEAQLTLDMMDGPAVQVWQSPSATPGVYQVACDVWRSNAPVVSVVAWVIDRSSGKRMIPVKPLTRGDRMIPVATLRVNTDGSTDLQLTN